METSEYGIFEVVTTEIWEGTIVWDAQQGDSLITSPIPLGVYDYYRVYLDGIANMAIGWYVINDMPTEDWEVAVANTGETNQIFRAFKPWNKYKLKVGFKARTTEERTVKFCLVKYRF